jgi:hypothetical protein
VIEISLAIRGPPPIPEYWLQRRAIPAHNILVKLRPELPAQRWPASAEFGLMPFGRMTLPPIPKTVQAPKRVWMDSSLARGDVLRWQFHWSVRYLCELVSGSSS